MSWLKYCLSFGTLIGTDGPSTFSTSTGVMTFFTMLTTPCVRIGLDWACPIQL